MTNKSELDLQTEKRLISCFRVAMPDLPRSEVPTAALGEVPEWDSLMTIMLFELVHEEFGVQIGFDRVPELNSFQRLLTFLQARVS